MPVSGYQIFYSLLGIENTHLPIRTGDRISYI